MSELETALWPCAGLAEDMQSLGGAIPALINQSVFLRMTNLDVPPSIQPLNTKIACLKAPAQNMVAKLYKMQTVRVDMIPTSGANHLQPCICSLCARIYNLPAYINWATELTSSICSLRTLIHLATPGRGWHKPNRHMQQIPEEVRSPLMGRGHTNPRGSSLLRRL